MSIHAIGNRSISFDPGTYGQSNPVVEEVQHTLNRINQTSEIPETGVFDHTTETALRDFQNSHGLPGTGVINQETINELNEVAEGAGSVPGEGTEPSGPSSPGLSEAERGRRLQEMRIQEPVVRQELEGGTPMRSSYSIEPRELGRERFSTAAQALNDPYPHRISVQGRDFRVCGASDTEARVIQNSLERLPASHLERIPPTITVSERLSNQRVRGGAQFPNDTEHPRIELSRQSLQNATAREVSGRHQTVSSTLLHEAGHCVGSGMYGPGGEVYRHQGLENIPADVPKSARDPETRSHIEQYAQAYMMFFGGSDRRRPNGLTPQERAAMNGHFQSTGIPVQ